MSALADILLTEATRPFAIAGTIMVGIGLVEICATLVGFSLSQMIGKDFDLDADADGLFSGWLLWVNAGRVPLLILVVLLLGLFAAWGFAIQTTAGAMWTMLPAWAASIAAATLALPGTRTASRAIARVIPRDETYAVSEQDFVGRVAEVTLGPLDQGLPGRVRVRDAHGHWHTFPAKAAPESPALPAGSHVLLVERAAAVFLATPAPADLVPSSS